MMLHNPVTGFKRDEIHQKIRSEYQKIRVPRKGRR